MSKMACGFSRSSCLHLQGGKVLTGSSNGGNSDDDTVNSVEQTVISKEQTVGSEEQTLLIKSPVQLAEIVLLSKHNAHELFISMSQEIQNFLQNARGNTAVYFLDTAAQFIRSQRTHCDLPVIRLALGYLAAGRIEMREKLYHKKLKTLQKHLHVFSLDCPFAVDLVINILLFMDYISGNKVGKAQGCLEKARGCFWKSGINLWSVDALDCEASMCLTLAQLLPTKRQHYLDKASSFYSLAIDLCLELASKDPNDAHFFKAALYLVHQAFIELDMPSPGILRLFQGTDILMQHGKISGVTESRIIRALAMLESCETYTRDCGKLYQENIGNYIGKTRVYVAIRKLQCFLSAGLQQCAFKCLDEARTLHKQWCAIYAQDKVTSTSAFAVQVPHLLGFLEELVYFRGNTAGKSEVDQTKKGTPLTILHRNCCFKSLRLLDHKEPDNMLTKKLNWGFGTNRPIQ